MTETKEQIKVLQDKLAAESQAVVNDLFRKILSIEDEKYSLEISGWLESDVNFHGYPHDPYQITYIHKDAESDSVYATLRVQKGVEL